MLALKEELVVEEAKYFFCIFLDKEGENCLSEKKKCPKKRESKKCQEAEDTFQ